MYLMILGAPGSGKGTQGKLLAQRLGLPQISTGDLIRAAMKDGTPLGVQAKAYYDKGLLVPDEVIFGLIQQILDSPPAKKGVVRSVQGTGKIEDIQQRLVEVAK